MIELLILKGSNIEAQAAFARTPLLKVVCTDTNGNNRCLEFGISRRMPIIKTLMRWGANYQANKDQFDAFLRERREYAQKHEYSWELDAINNLSKYLNEFSYQREKESVALSLSHLNVDHAKISSELSFVMKEYIQEPVSVVACQNQKLCQAISNDAERDIKRIITAYPQLLEQADELGYTPLLRAVYQGKTGAVETLCKLGANLLARNKYKQTAYMIAEQQYKATENEDLQTFKAILNENTIKRELAEKEKNEAEQERLKKEEADAFANLAQLKQAIVDNTTDALKDCLKPASVNKKYVDGSCPLIHAASLGRTTIMARLLAHGAQLGARDEQYNTALMHATIRGDIDTIALLLQHMTPAEIKATADGRTAYDLAKNIAQRIEKQLHEDASTETIARLKQDQQKYEQIMMLLDSYMNMA